jgi:hypothetical protein
VRGGHVSVAIEARTQLLELIGPLQEALAGRGLL